MSEIKRMIVICDGCGEEHAIVAPESWTLVTLPPDGTQSDKRRHFCPTCWSVAWCAILSRVARKG